MYIYIYILLYNTYKIYSTCNMIYVYVYVYVYVCICIYIYIYIYI